MSNLVRPLARVIAVAVAVAAALSAGTVAQQNQNAERCAEIRRMLDRIGDVRVEGNKRVYSGGELDTAREALKLPAFELDVVEALIAAEAAGGGDIAGARARAAEGATLRHEQSLTPRLKALLDGAPNRRGAISAELQALQAQLSASVRDLKEEENAKVRLINLFTDQLSELQCPNAPPRVKDIAGGGGGTGAGTTGGTATGGGGTAAGNPGGGQGAEVEWTGNWKHDYGTLLLQPTPPGGLIETLREVNGAGPALACPADAKTFTGQLVWTAPQSLRFTPFTATIRACAAGRVLHAKFSNIDEITSGGAAGGGVIVGYFSITQAPSGRGFQGSVRRWYPEQRMRAPEVGTDAWFGSRQ